MVPGRDARERQQNAPRRSVLQNDLSRLATRTNDAELSQQRRSTRCTMRRRQNKIELTCTAKNSAEHVQIPCQRCPRATTAPYSVQGRNCGRGRSQNTRPTTSEHEPTAASNYPGYNADNNCINLGIVSPIGSPCRKSWAPTTGDYRARCYRSRHQPSSTMTIMMMNVTSTKDLCYEPGTSNQYVSTRKL